MAENETKIKRESTTLSGRELIQLVIFTPVVFVWLFLAADTGVYTLRLKFDATTLETRTGLSGNNHMCAGFQASPSVGSHTVTITIQRTDDQGSSSFGSSVGFREVSV